MAPTPQNSSPISLLTLRRQASAIGAACGNAARADLCGERWATGVPTATGLKPTERLRASRGRRCKGREITTKTTLWSERRSALKKGLTGPTLLEMPVYPGAQDFHLQAIEHARHTTKRPALVFRRPLFLFVLRISGLLFLGGYASRNPRSNLVEHIQPLLRLLAPWTVGIKINRMLVSFDRSRLHVRDILIANFLETHRANQYGAKQIP